MVKHNSLLDASSFLGSFLVIGQRSCICSEKEQQIENQVSSQVQHADPWVGAAAAEWPRCGLEAAPASALFTSATWASMARSKYRREWQLKCRPKAIG